MSSIYLLCNNLTNQKTNKTTKQINKEATTFSKFVTNTNHNNSQTQYRRTNTNNKGTRKRITTRPQLIP
jgi:hypothetical protein